MRLIDADALNDAMFRKSFETDDGRQQWDGGLWIRYKVFEEARDEAPTIDAVPVVPCKDCKWSNVYQVDSNFPMERWCDGGFIPKSVQDDDYCSFGERKDDETDRR